MANGVMALIDTETVGVSPSQGKTDSMEETQDHDQDDASIQSSASSSIASSLDSDISSDDSSDEDDDDNQSGHWRSSLTLMERQARNVERNNRFLGSLHEKYKPLLPPSLKRPRPSRRDDEGEHDEEEEDVPSSKQVHPTGIFMKDSYRLFSSTQLPDSTLSYHELVHQVLDRYPHREQQIHQLLSVLDANISMAGIYQRQVHVPSPIFCVGPPSTGKTSVVCDVLEMLNAKHRPKDSLSTDTKACSDPGHQLFFKAAYVDCSIVEPSSIEHLVALIYRQLQPSSHSTQKIKRKVSKSKKKQCLISTQVVSKEVDHISTKERDGNKESTALENENKNKRDVTTEEKLGGSSRRVLPSRNAKTVQDRENNARKAASTRSLQPNTEHVGGQPQKKEDNREKVESTNSAVVSLGRSLQQYYGVSATRIHSAVLVLDRAEELLSLTSSDKKSNRRHKQKKLGASSSSSNNNRTTNFLAELLLLPKIMRLNLTVIVVTNYATLDKTREFHSFAPMA
jgi:Cdc6-like AAA superfamily ATPase